MENDSRIFIETSDFTELWHDMKLTDEDLRELQNRIWSNPQVGDTIKGTSGARKTRVKLFNTGKSGGARVIYVNTGNITYLMLCYPKSVKDDLTKEQENQLKQKVIRIKGGDKDG